MEKLKLLKTQSCCRFLALISLICAVLFQAGVHCQEKAITAPNNVLAVARGDNILTTKGQEQVVVFPTLLFSTQTTVNPETVQDGTTHGGVAITAESAGQQDTKAPQHTSTDQPDVQPRNVQPGPVVCVDKSAVEGKDAVKLKLKTTSSCEENKPKIQSIKEHLCGEDSKLEIYQQDQTDEMIVSGPCIQDDPKGMTDKFNNDNIKDKVGVEDAEPILVKHSRIVLISVLLAGLLLAALLIAGYVLKTHRTESKGMRLAEESYQVDEPNQGNTLLSQAPLPPQEPLDKPTSNGESPETPPTNGHSTTQTPVADTQM